MAYLLTRLHTLEIFLRLSTYSKAGLLTCNDLHQILVNLFSLLTNGNSIGSPLFIVHRPTLLQTHTPSRAIKSWSYQQLLHPLTNQIAHQGFWIFSWLKTNTSLRRWMSALVVETLVANGSKSVRSFDFCRSKRPSIETTVDRTDLYSKVVSIETKSQFDRRVNDYKVLQALDNNR